MLIRPSAIMIAVAVHAAVVVVFVLVPSGPAAPVRDVVDITTVTTAPPELDVPPEPPHVDPPSTPVPVIVRQAPRVHARVVRDEPAPGPKSPDPDPAPAGGSGDDGGGAGSGSGFGGDGSGGGGGTGGGGDGDRDLSARPVPIDTASAQVLPYTADAMRDRVEGDVTLVLQIDAAGNVSATMLHKGIGHGLDEIAAGVARKFKFRPALDRHGEPTPGAVKWRFHFTRPS